MSQTRIRIEELHALYTALTGHALFLNADRERMWFEWLRYRNPPFTSNELGLVIRRIKRGIEEGSRNVGALKFRNLIGQPDYFEEDLAEATARARPLPPQEKVVKTGNVERIVPTTGCEPRERAIGDVALNLLRKLKDSADMPSVQDRTIQT